MSRIMSIGGPSLAAVLAIAAIAAAEFPALSDIDRDMGDILKVKKPEAEKPQRQNLAEMKAAFERAAQLRDQDYNVVRIKGTHPYAIRTNDTKLEEGATYVKVLIPYSQIEMRNARDKFHVLVDNPKPHMRRGVHMPVRMHEQWVREDRLSKVNG